MCTHNYKPTFALPCTVFQALRGPNLLLVSANTSGGLFPYVFDDVDCELLFCLNMRPQVRDEATSSSFSSSWLNMASQGRPLSMPPAEGLVSLCWLCADIFPQGPPSLGVYPLLSVFLWVQAKVCSLVVLLGYGAGPLEISFTFWKPINALKSILQPRTSCFVREGPLESQCHDTASRRRLQLL